VVAGLLRPPVLLSRPRGGANSVPWRAIRRSPLISTYQPDTTNNYEAGLKGRFSNGFSYTVAVFDIKWDKPQISSSLPSGNLAVYNANTAESRASSWSRAARCSAASRLFRELCLCDAHLTSDFSLPANNGLQTGTIVPGLIHGTSGEQMPGSPKTSASAGVVYDMNVSPGYDLALAANGVYRGVRTDATVAHAGRNDRAAIIELRDHESLGSTDSQALAHGPVRDNLFDSRIFWSRRRSSTSSAS